jgi:acetyltransferase-like isoleucine patch superfamily enzyme
MLAPISILLTAAHNTVALLRTDPWTMSLRQTLATSPHPAAAAVRRLRAAYYAFTLPAPKVVVRPLLWTFLLIREIYFFCYRVLVCEPLFKAYCKSYGKNVRTNVFIHWVVGKGDIVIGDDVEIRGKCSFVFGARFVARPTLLIGSHTRIGHSSTFVVGKNVTVGDHCLIASEVVIFDSSGHPSDPAARLASLPPRQEDVKPVTIGRNVWIGFRSIISPGVTIGDNSVVAAGSVVVTDVPPNSIVAGYPARRIGNLEPPEPLAERHEDQL